jgi:ribosomal protein L35
MPKMKTHKGLAKVAKKRPGGTVKIGKPGSRHNTGKENAAAKRANRKGSEMSQGDKNRFKKLAN